MYGLEKNIINEIMKKCTSKEISDALIYRLNEKWGCPDLSIDYKTDENKSVLSLIKEYYEKHNLIYNLEERTLEILNDIESIYDIKHSIDIIQIHFYRNGILFESSINKEGKLIGINTEFLE